MSKKNVRVELKNNYTNFSQEYKLSASKEIAKKLALYFSKLHIKRYASYYTTEPSFELNLNIFRHTNTSYIEYLPKIIGNDLSFCKYDKNNLCKNDKFNVMEPTERCEEIDIIDLDIVIVPMLGFNDSFYRLGRGGGFYDRLFEKHPHQKYLGVCYKEGLCHFQEDK